MHKNKCKHIFAVCCYAAAKVREKSVRILTQLLSVDGRYNMNKHEALLQKLCQVLGSFCIYPLTPILLLLLLYYFRSKLREGYWSCCCWVDVECKKVQIRNTPTSAIVSLNKGMMKIFGFSKKGIPRHDTEGRLLVLAAGSTDSGLHVKRKFSGVLPPAVTTVINQDQLFQIYQLVPFTSRTARQRGA